MPFLKDLDALSDIAHQIGNLALAAEQRRQGAGESTDEGPMPDTCFP